MNKDISIYSLLKIVNIIVAILMLYVYFTYGNNQYINGTTILINSVQCLLTHIVLIDAEKNQNHLLAVLAFVMIMHFDSRVVSLNYTEFSVILNERVNINATGLNKVLLFVVSSYTLTWLGFHFSKKGLFSKNEILLTYKPKATRNILMVLYGALLISVLGSIGVPGISQLVGILSTFFLNLLFMMLFGVGYFLFRWKEISYNHKLAFLSFIILYVAIYTAMGSRSTIYDVALVSFFCLLAFDKVKIKAKYILMSLLLLPVMIWTFSFATLARQYGEKTLSISSAIEMSGRLTEQTDGEDMKFLLTPIFNRIGFLDFTIEMVHNRDHLKSVLTAENYIKSVIDNLLTPGFNLFDMPKISCIISKSYYITGPPTVTNYKVNEEYQSDATSWYGEFYVLFGKYLALPFIFFVSLYMRRLYVKYLKKRTLTIMWKRVILLYLLYTLLYSYGLDWWLIYFVSFVINYEIFKSVTIRKDKKSTKLSYSN